MPNETFQQAHEKATEMLDAAESEAGESLRPLGKTPEEIAAESEAIMEKMIAPIIKCIGENFDERRTTRLEEDQLIRETLSPLIPGTTNNTAQTIINEVIRSGEWGKIFLRNKIFAGRLLSILASLLSEKGLGSSFEFSESDFSSSPEGFGHFFQEPTELVLRGNAGDWAGNFMKGGKITILGNAGSYVGFSMTGGIIVVEGNTDGLAGWDMIRGTITIEGNTGVLAGSNMTGGTLDIRGEVASFNKSAFALANLGTIIWKGVKIWEDGYWTPEGEKMNDEKLIPKE